MFDPFETITNYSPPNLEEFLTFDVGRLEIVDSFQSCC